MGVELNLRQMKRATGASVELPKLRQPGRLRIVSVEDATDSWLNLCRVEGCKGKNPVSKATIQGYEYRAGI